MANVCLYPIARMSGRTVRTKNTSSYQPSSTLIQYCLIYKNSYVKSQYFLQSLVRTDGVFHSHLIVSHISSVSGIVVYTLVII